jgi:hypothetical protein
MTQALYAHMNNKKINLKKTHIRTEKEVNLILGKCSPIPEILHFLSYLNS